MPFWAYLIFGLIGTGGVGGAISVWIKWKSKIKISQIEASRDITKEIIKKFSCEDIKDLSEIWNIINNLDTKTFFTKYSNNPADELKKIKSENEK